MTAVFLQVRMDSSRLPGKALLPLADRTVIEHAIRALDGVPTDIHCILTTEDSVTALEIPARKYGWDVFVGPKDDVLARYVLAARKFDVDRLVRATGDNPLVSRIMANSALDLAVESGAAYAGFSGLPIGAGVELISVEKLEEAFREATDPYEREHVAPFLYHHPERYQLEIPPAPPEFCAPDIRITLDTPEDYAFLQQLYRDLYSGEILDLDVVVPYLKSVERCAV